MQDCIDRTVDSCHDGIEFDVIFKSDDPHAKNIKNICWK